MNNKRKRSKPLHHFPSAKRKDDNPVHWRKSRKRYGKKHYFLKILKLTMVVFAVGFVSLGIYLWQQTQNGALRSLAQEKLAVMVGSNIVSNVGDVRLSFGGDNLINVNAATLDLNDAKNNNLLDVGKISLGVSSLSLLVGDVDINSVNLENVKLKLPKKADLVNGAEGQDEEVLEISNIKFKKVLRALHQQLSEVFHQLEQREFEKLSLKDVQVSGLKQYGLNSDFLVMKNLEAATKNQGDTWKLTAAFIERGKEWGIKAIWALSDGGERKLDVALNDVVLSELLNNDFSNEEQLAVDGTVRLDLHLTYAADGEPTKATADLNLSAGKLKLPHEPTKSYDEGLFKFELNLDQNSINMMPSLFVAGNTQMRLKGVAQLLRAESQGKPAAIGFNLTTLEAFADVEETGTSAVPFKLDVVGQYLLDEKQLQVSTLKAESPEGNILGSVSLDFNGETPAMKLDLKIPEMSVKGFKQLWPYPVAPKARSWVLKNVVEGQVKNAYLTADIPHGILGRLKKGKVIKKGQMLAEVPISNGRFKVADGFPFIQGVTTTVKLDGMNTSLKLDKGYGELLSGGRLDFAKSSLLIEGEKPAPDPAHVNLKIKAAMRDVLTLVSHAPIDAQLPKGLEPENVTGTFDGAVKIDFTLKKEIKKADIKWDADFDVINFATKQPIQDVDLSSPKLHVHLTAKQAKITGDAEINDIPANINILEVLDKKSKAVSSKEISVLVDEELRKKFGINLDSILTGSLPVKLTIKGASNAYNVSADLTNAELKLPWMNWTKGKGIAGKLSFKFLDKGDQKAISDFKLSGKTFFADGELTLDNGELKRANFKKIALNSGDNISLNLAQNNNVYDVKINGKSFDARAVIRKILDGADEASTGLKDAGGFNLSANIDVVKGFNKRTLKQTNIALTYKKGVLQNLILKGQIANSGLMELTIAPKGGAKETRFNTTNAGASFAFFNLYDKMKGGRAHAELIKQGEGPYQGEITFRDFVIVQEPRLKRLVSQPVKDYTGRDKSLPIDPSAVKFIKASAFLEKGNGYLKVKHGLIRNDTIGSSFTGTVFDQNDRMDLSGTFMPAYGLNRLFGKIPLLGIFLGNGSEGGLFGITYRLSGNAKNPRLALNPLSVVTPGIFRQIFQIGNEQ